MQRQSLLISANTSLDRGRRVATFLAEAWRSQGSAPPPLDLAEIAPLLLASGAGALGWWRIRTAALEGPVPRRLRGAYRFHSMYALRHEHAVATAFRFLQKAGCAALLGKGWAAARLYPEPGLRPYGDIDLYVPAAAYEAVRALVESPANPGVFIDLHRGFSVLDDRPEPELYRRSLVASAGGEQVRLLGHEDHLRLLCLHLLGHGGWRPLWLCDVAVAVEGRPPGFDWDYFQQGDPIRTEAVACVLTLAAELLGARLEGVPPALAPRRLPEWIARTLLCYWGDPSFIPQGRRIPMSELRSPREIIKGLGQRWPNAIEATMARRARFDAAPRLPLQLAECAARIVRFARS